MSFLDASTPDEHGTLALLPAWLQGRGVYGGAVGGAMVRAMERFAGGRLLRSFTAHFCAPAAPGEAKVVAEVLRPGGRIASLRAEVRGSELYAFSVASFGTARPVSLAWEDRRFPQVTGPEDAPELPLFSFGAPIFTQHFCYRPAGETTFFSGAKTARLALWIRPVVPVPLDMALVVGLLDSGPTGIIAKDTFVRPIASVDFRVQIPGALPDVAADAFFLLDSYAEQVADGYASETRLLWTQEGRLIAECRQLIAILA